MITNYCSCHKIKEKKMTDLEAIEKCIEHWKDNLKKAEKGEKFSIGSDLCALCDIYGLCEGCPISIETGLRGCRDTPYEDVTRDLSLRKCCVESVKEEIAFLESLRDKMKEALNE
jgi:hypothetical protein